jgi:hypothetical protein
LGLITKPFLLQDKDGLLKEIEKVRVEAAAAAKHQLNSEKETQLLQERGRRLEAEIASLKADIEKGLSHRQGSICWKFSLLSSTVHITTSTRGGVVAYLIGKKEKGMS